MIDLQSITVVRYSFHRVDWLILHHKNGLRSKRKYSTFYRFFDSKQKYDANLYIKEHKNPTSSSCTSAISMIDVLLFSSSFLSHTIIVLFCISYKDILTRVEELFIEVVFCSYCSVCLSLLYMSLCVCVRIYM